MRKLKLLFNSTCARVAQLDGTLIDAALCACPASWNQWSADAVNECPIDRHIISWLHSRWQFDDEGNTTLEAAQQSACDLADDTTMRLRHIKPGSIALED